MLETFRGRCEDFDVDRGSRRPLSGRNPKTAIKFRELAVRDRRMTLKFVFFFPHLSSRCVSINIYRVSQEECARLREGVPYVKVYRYNPKHLCPKLNG